MRNTSYSPLFNEGLDFSCAIFDEQGEMIAQARVLSGASRSDHLRRRVDDPGDRAGELPARRRRLPQRSLPGRMPSSRVLRHQAGLLRWRTRRLRRLHRAHDRGGGKVPGGFAGDATEVFQEGIRIPPLKIVEGGRDVEAIWNIILANVRTPRMSYGDMKAMIGSLHVGEQRIDRAPREATASAQFREIKEAIKDYSERRMRAEIAEMPDGVYHFEDIRHRERRRSRTSPASLKVAVTIDGDRMTVDYTGSDPQRRGPGQLHVRRDGVRDVQRASPPHGSLDPVEPRLLPPGSHHRATRARS